MWSTGQMPSFETAGRSVPGEIENTASFGRMALLVHSKMVVKDTHRPLESATTMKEMAEHLGRAAGKKLDDARYGTADALTNAACSIRTGSRRGSETIDGLARNAAYKLDATAAYVRNHKVGDMLVSLRQAIRRHPTGFFVGAAALGILALSATRRK